MTNEEALEFAKMELERAEKIVDHVEESDKDYVNKAIEFLKNVVYTYSKNVIIYWGLPK
jgi:hypothetical protein